MAEEFGLNPGKLPSPGTKKRGSWVIWIVGVALVVLVVTAIKAGQSTKDPKKAVADASKEAQAQSQEEGAKSTREAAGNLVGANGERISVGEREQRDLEAKVKTADLEAEASKEEANRKEYKQQETVRLRREGVVVPGSINPETGHPNGEENGPSSLVETGPVSGRGRAGNSGAMGGMAPIPGYPEGFDPEREVVYPAANGFPAFRRVPAYQRHGNRPTTAAEHQHLEDIWMGSLRQPSFGASSTTNDLYNQGLEGGLQVKQGVRGRSVAIPLGPGASPVNQPAIPTPIMWETRAPTESGQDGIKIISPPVEPVEPRPQPLRHKTKKRAVGPTAPTRAPTRASMEK